jgi:hypothetical protein
MTKKEEAPMGGIAIGGIRGGTGLKHRAALADNVTERPNVTRIEVKHMHEEIVFDTRMKKESSVFQFRKQMLRI